MVACTNTGGLGNCLFIQATLFAFAKKHNLEYAIPTTIDNPHYEGQQAHRFPGFNYSDDIPLLPVFQEQQFHYKPLPFMDFVTIQGYFQSWKYFNDYRKELLEAIGFNKKTRNNICSVHIRLDDYLDKPECHPPITKGYIFEAMMNVMTRVQDWEAVKFLVFSDSPRMAKEMLSSKEFKSFPIEYAEGNDEVYDLELMSSCEHNITANSAFSLMAAYINQNPNKIIVSPRNWFGNEMRHNNTKDLYLPNSVIL